MHEETVQHTISVLRQLADFVRPILPSDIRGELDQALEQVENDYSLTLEEVEDTMIVFGKKVWPYRKAYLELLATQEGKIGEHFLEGKLSGKLRKQYQEYKKKGGSLRDLHLGRGVDMFEGKDRQKLCEVLVDLSLDLRKNTT